nr:ribonuclease H-like domain-containing protein [Tanacetum cinerariifolium]
MTSLFAESHNMVAILEKSDAAGGFEQIIDFLSGSYIQHALTVNPHVYISCIKQFWNTAVVKRSGDVTRLQALVDKKMIVITEEVVREILQLDDAEGVKGLTLTQKVFANMRRVGKGFSGVETPLFETMLEVRAVDAEEQVHIPAQDDAIQENVTEQVAADVGTSQVIDDVAPPTSPLPPSPIIPSTPPHQSPSPPQPQAAEGSSQLVKQLLDKCSALILRVEGWETANVTQQLEIIQLKARVKKLERLNKGRISVDIDEGIELEVDQEKSVEEDTEVQEVVEVVNAAKLITEVVTAAVSAPVPAAKPAAKTKVLKIAVAPAVLTRKRKGVVKQKKDGIFISQDKYVAEILRKFGLSEGKSASTPIDAEKPLLKDSDGEDVDVHTY